MESPLILNDLPWSDRARSLTPMSAIGLKCLDCCCGSRRAVRECEITDCSNHFLRLRGLANASRALVEGKRRVSDEASLKLKNWRESQAAPQTMMPAAGSGIEIKDVMPTT